MKIVHLLASACGLFLCILAFGPLTAADAQLHLESCMEGGECDTAAKGTTFEAEGEVVLQNGFIEEACSSALKGEVVATLSPSGTENIEASIAEAAYSSCSEGSALPQGLSWSLTTNTVQFPEGLVAGGVQFILHIGGGTGDCNFEEDATHMPNVVWKNGKPTTLKVSGSLKKVAGSTSCGAEANLSGSYELTSVSDPKLAEAANLQILEGPTMAEELEEEELVAEEWMKAELSPVRMETCHKPAAECSLASEGTVIQATGELLFTPLFFSVFPPTSCESEFEAKVELPAAVSTNYNLSLAVTSLSIFNCWPSPFAFAVDEAEFPWELKTSESKFESGLAGSLVGELLFLQTTEKAKCHFYSGNWIWHYTPGKGEKAPLLDPEGILNVVSGGLSCVTASVQGIGGYEISLVADPELPEAKFVQILG